MHRLGALSALICALAASLPAAAAAAPVPEGANYSEMYFDTPVGRLHADVFRPAQLPADAKTPVILTVSPYTNHSGSTITDPPDFQGSGPNPRFFDFVEGAKLMERGYTYAVVDLPGFGGSGGCTDWGGPNEQLGTKAAVEWASKADFSTGKVGMYGKSYDGWTGLMAIAQQPAGLAAVVSAEPVYAGYRYLYSDGIRFAQSATMGPVFGSTNLMPGTLSDTPEYQVNSAPTTPWCVATLTALEQQDNPQAGFWQVRDLIPALKGRTTPLFLTQGFLEDNTKPDGAFDVYAGMAGPKRAWFGEWDHVRGNDRVKVGSTERLAMGREGWFDEVMRFYDEHLKGIAPTVEAPTVVLQDGTGRWRSEAAWPPADSRLLSTELTGGTYTDDGSGNGTGSDATDGLWTVSQALPYTVHLAGEPVAVIDADTVLPNANLVVAVYDIDGAGQATLVSRGGRLIRSAGLQTITLYGNDWPIRAGHRIGVRISDSHGEWYVHVPTQQDVTVRAARIALPFLARKRSYDLTGASSVKLDDYKAEAPFAAPPNAPVHDFSLPQPLEMTG
jgi:pimeloyl-ACP methyl ester carboxylesterase